MAVSAGPDVACEQYGEIECTRIMLCLLFLPAGRGGSCELMIGCVAKAESQQLNVDLDEMDEVRTAYIYYIISQDPA